jgi:hypothetical protein
MELVKALRTGFLYGLVPGAGLFVTQIGWRYVRGASPDWRQAAMSSGFVFVIFLGLFTIHAFRDAHRP